MKKLLAIMLGCCLTSFCPIASQADSPAPPAKSLTLQECIDLAMKNQVDLKVAQNGVVSAKAKLSSSKAAYFPSIQYNLGATLRDSNTNDNDLNTNDNFFNASYNIYDGGAREAKVRAASANTKVAQENLKRVTQTVVYQITQNYFEVLRQLHLLEVADQQVAYAEGQLNLVRGRINSGDAASSDIYPVQAQLLNAQVSQIAAQNRLRVANIELQRSIGLNPSSDFKIEDISQTPTVTVPDEEASLKEAIVSRPDLKQAKASVDASHAGVSLASTQVYPQLIANAQMSQEVIGSPAERDWAAFAGISFNVFDGGAARANLRDSRSALNTSQARMDQLQKDIAAEVREAILNQENAAQRLEATQASLKAANKNAEVQEEKYKQGLAIPLDLLNAQVAAATAQTDAVQALYDYYTSVAQLQLAIGK